MRGLFLYGGLLLVVSTLTTVAILTDHDLWEDLGLGILWLITLVAFIFSYRRHDSTMAALVMAQEENAQTSTWFQESPDLHCTTNIATETFVLLSPGWERVLGWTLKEMTSRPYYEFLHPDDRIRTDELVETHKKPGDITDRFVNRYRHKNGHWVWMEWVGHSDGEYGYATARDITHWYEQHIDLKHWLLIGLDLVATTNPTKVDHWGFVSPGLLKMLGYTQEELTRVSWKKFIYNGNVTNVSVGDHHTRFKTLMATSSGKLVWLQWTTTDDPVSGRVYMSAVDISDIVRTQNEMKEAISDLEIANAALSRFASMAAHQLRSPPRGIIGATQVLKEDFAGQLPPEVLEYLEDIRLDAYTMSNVVDGLHRVSDVRRLGEVELTSVCLHEVVQEIKATKARKGFFEGGTRQLHIELGGCPQINGDRVLLTEALTNLIDNGFKFNNSDVPTVWISCCPSSCQDDDGFIEVAVRDNGVGIDMTYKHKLFGLFERLTTKFEGTGVGLYLTRILVERMRGHVEVQSVLGEGSTFTVHLVRYGFQDDTEEINTLDHDPFSSSPDILPLG